MTRRLRRAARWLLTGYHWAWPLGYAAGLLVGRGHFIPGSLVAATSPWLVGWVDRGGRALADRIDPLTTVIDLPGGVLTIHEQRLSREKAEEMRRALTAAFEHRKGDE